MILTYGEEVPEKIKYDNDIFIYDKDRKDYIHQLDSDGWVSETLLFKMKDIHFVEDFINVKVEIIEEEPEIDIQGIEETEIKKDGRMDYFKYCNDGETESGYGVNYSKSDIATRKIINELIKAVKQLDKQIKEK